MRELTGKESVFADVDECGMIDFDAIYPLRLSDGNHKRYKTYVAKVKGIDEKGEEVREYIKENSTDNFNKNDFVLLGFWDAYKRRGAKSIYIVGDTDENGNIELIYKANGIEINTFRQAYKALYNEVYKKGKMIA